MLEWWKTRLIDKGFADVAGDIFMIEMDRYAFWFLKLMYFMFAVIRYESGPVELL